MPRHHFSSAYIVGVWTSDVLLNFGLSLCSKVIDKLVLVAAQSVNFIDDFAPQTEAKVQNELKDSDTCPNAGKSDDMSLMTLPCQQEV